MTRMRAHSTISSANARQAGSALTSIHAIAASSRWMCGLDSKGTVSGYYFSPSQEMTSVDAL